MCKVWGVATRKGGVGKTTTSTTMAYLLAKAGYKVALIDFDGQRHSTKLSGVMLPEKLPITIYEILSSLVMGEELPEIETYIIHTESGVDLIPANNRLDYFDKLMCNTDFAEYKLKEYVDTIRDRYDYILIDGMPKMGTAMINIMAVRIKKKDGNFFNRTMESSRSDLSCYSMDLWKVCRICLYQIRHPSGIIQKCILFIRHCIIRGQRRF